jgi:4-amino-4-deoxy-L-arabinose transferase-like glycosyltransferase
MQIFPNVDEYRHQDLIWLLVVVFVFLAIGIGLRDPWPADEPRFALIAKTMVDSGQWLFPIRGGELYPDKPPLFMWSIAVIYALTDSLRVAFLLPSAIAGTVTALALFDITRRLWNSRVAWASVALLLASIQFVLQAKAAQIDASVCLWITLGCYGLLRALFTPNSRKWWFLGCICMGLGIMTKGVGFLPLLMLVPYSFVLWREKHSSRVLMRHPMGVWLSGVLLMLATLLLWLLPMLLAVSGSDSPDYQAYRDNIMLKQTVTRYADSWHHIKPFWYFITSVIPWAWLPIVILIPWLVAPWCRAWKNNDGRVLLPLGFVLLVLLFFSLSPGKRGVYILPALPMLVLAVAPFLGSLSHSKAVSRMLWGLVIILTATLLGLGLVTLFNGGPLLTFAAQQATDLGLLLTVMGGVLVVLLVTQYRRHGFVAWGVFVGVFWLIYSSWLAILLNPMRTPQHIWQEVVNYVPIDGQVALIETGEQFMLFSQRDIVHFGYHTPAEIQLLAAWAWSGKGNNRYVLVSADASARCFDLTDAIDVGFAHRHHWLLLSASARRDMCDLPDAMPKTFKYSPNQRQYIDHK